MVFYGLLLSSPPSSLRLLLAVVIFVCCYELDDARPTPSSPPSLVVVGKLRHPNSNESSSFGGSSGRSRIPKECDSFYDYVCEPERKDKPVRSYFELLRRRTEKLVEETILSPLPYETTDGSSYGKSPYGKCVSHQLRVHGDGSAVKRAMVGLKRSNDNTDTAAGDYSFYDIHESSKAMFVESSEIKGYFPVRASLEAVLNASSTSCLNVYPDLKWLKAVKLWVDGTESTTDCMTDFIAAALESFEKDTTSQNDADVGGGGGGGSRYDYLERYAKSYTDIGSVRKWNPFWADALSEFLPPSLDERADTVCVHLNGYESFYETVSSLLTASFEGARQQQQQGGSPSVLNQSCYRTGGYDALTQFSDVARNYMIHLEISNRLDRRGPYIAEAYRSLYREVAKTFWTERCYKDVKSLAPTTSNVEFLALAGFDDNGKGDVVRKEVVGMIEKLKTSMIEEFKMTSHLPPAFKNFVVKKISAIVPFVLTASSSSSSSSSSSAVDGFLLDTTLGDIVRSEEDCYYGTDDDSWTDIVQCLVGVKYRVLSGRMMPHDEGLRERRWAEIFYDTDVSIVNAWYDPTKNEITIPAAILQRPMYYGGGDPFDYARMGTILGHELGHSVDVHGLCWDPHGNFVPLLDKDLHGGAGGGGLPAFCPPIHPLPEHYEKGAKCLNEDYGHPCDPDDGYGENTLGEDIADQVGLIASGRIFSTHFSEEEEIRLEDKRDFYRRYAQLWCDGRRFVSTSSTPDTHWNRLDAFKKDFSSLSSFITVDELQDRDGSLFTDYKVSGSKAKRPGGGRGTESLCDKVKNDVHALPKHRVNKTLRQIHNFARLFDCHPGDPMVKKEPCLVY